MRVDHRSRARRGAHLVEMSLVFMIFFTILMAIIQYGYIICARQVVDNAAREAARAAVSANTTDTTGYNYRTDAQVKQIAADLVGSLGLKDSGGSPFTAADVIVNQVDPVTLAVVGGNNDGSWTSNTSGGETIAVTINGRITPFGLWFFNADVPVQATVLMRSEGN